MKTLIVNTYAGSLLLGADAIAGSKIVGSYEDVGFGSANTKANRARFQNLEPEFEFIDRYKDWPDQDLTETILLAHPPCAAFSQQNTSKAKRGINTDAFECTRKVMKYAFTNGAAALAVESVMGAMAGAWDVHQHLADAAGYHVYRVLKNSILFGVPQYRERFWVVFVRKGLANPEMTWRLAPLFRSCHAVLDGTLDGQQLGLSKTVDKFVKQLTAGPCRCGATHGFNEEQLRTIGLGHFHGYKREGFSQRIQPTFFPGIDKGEVCRKHVSPFTSGQPSVLAPYGWSPVLLGSSLWYYQGRPVTAEGYKAIMGFPTDYVFPPDKHYGVRTFLSKGVCPPVATWVLDNLRMHLGLASGSPFTSHPSYVKVVSPDHIVSFRPGRQTLLDKFQTMMKADLVECDEPVDLRNEEEALEED